MEIDEKMANAIAKGYENFPIALKAVSEQLEKMNGLLDHMVSKQKAEDDEEEKKATEDKLLQRAVKELKKQGIVVNKGEALVTSDPAKITPQKQQETQPVIGKGNGEKEEEYEEVKANNDKEEEKKAEDGKEEDKEKEGCEEVKAEDDEEEKKKDEYPDVEKAIKSAVSGAVEDYMKKMGWVKAGTVTSKPKNFGADNVDIVKSTGKVDKEKAIEDLSKLSWRQLTQMQNDVSSGRTTFPNVD